jgi:ribosomal protein S18 acetylase RimI-like enzyme
VPVTIEELPADRLDDLEPLWQSLLEHHGRVSPPALRMVGAAESWPRRRRLYREWLGAPGAFVLVARLDGQLVAYALVSMHGSDARDDTWKSGETVAELQTLVTAPQGRGSGVGTQLLDAVEERLRESGTRDLLIGVVADNADALRFYERRGATPFYTQLYQRL